MSADPIRDLNDTEEDDAVAWTEDFPGPYHDGKVHVLSEKCSTCVFRPGNLMNLNSGRVKDMVEGSLAQESAITCHQTLPYNGQYDVSAGAICRGYFDAHGHKVQALQIAERLGLLAEVEPPKKKAKR